MSTRLPWRRGDKPRHFIATMPGGRAEVWWQARVTEPEGWRCKVVCGSTILTDRCDSKQHAADQATQFWSRALAIEQARLARLEARHTLEKRIVDAWRAGGVDVSSFELTAMEYWQLIAINEFLKEQGWLLGALLPLAEAVSMECYRRRVGAGATDAR